MPASTALYEPYRVVGLVSDNAPFVLQKLGDEVFLTAVVGNCFQVFKTERLVVCLVSKPAPGKITALQVSGYDTFVAVANKVYKYRRTHIIGTIAEHESDVTGLCLVGNILLSWDATNHVKIINTQEDKVIGELNFLHKAPITKVLHPASYINKFLFAFEDGELQLWNINSRKLIHSFRGYHDKILQKLINTPKEQAITCLGQSPACDVIGIGFASGDILLFNLKLDQIIFHFRQTSTVTAIAFRTDAQTDRYPFFVTGSAQGHFYTWTIGGSALEPTKVSPHLIFQELHAHDEPVIHLEFLHGEPVIVTAGADNTLKEWIYDQQDGSARLLRYRQGHSSYPRSIRYFGDISMAAEYGSGVNAMLNGVISLDGKGNLLFSRLEKHGFVEPFSHTNILKEQRRFYPCKDYDFCYLGARTWGNLVSIHDYQTTGYVWKVEDHAITTTRLTLPDYYQSKVTSTHSVIVSQCGNFAVIGYNSGVIGKFNIQSGLFRGTFPKILDKLYQKSSQTKGQEVSLKPSENVLLTTGHTGEIGGLFLDITNTVLVSIGNENGDGKVIFWSFQSHTVLHTIQLPFGCTCYCIRGHYDSSFVAIATINTNDLHEKVYDIRVYDITTYRLVRYFTKCHSDKITDMQFTADGKRLLSSSLDGSLRVYDLKTGHCLSWMLFDSAITSFTFALHGDLLVSTTATRGISVCIDRSLSQFFSFSIEPTEPTPVMNASQVVILTTTTDNAASEEEMEIDTLPEVNKPVTQEDGYSFSSLPKAYWTTICNLELIKKRNRLVTNKPKEAIPFLLQNVMNMNIKSSTIMNPSTVMGSKENNGNNVSKLPMPTTVPPPSSATETEESVAMTMIAFDETKGENEGEATEGTKKDNTRSSSKILRKQLQSRSKLSMILTELYTTLITPSSSSSSSSMHNKKPVAGQSRILSHHHTKPLLLTNNSNSNGMISIRTSLTSSLKAQQMMYTTLSTYLFSLTPAEIDIEFRNLMTNELSLSTTPPYIPLLLHYFAFALQQHIAFDVIQAYIYRFLLIYSPLILQTVSWQPDIEKLRDSATSSQQRLQLVIQMTLSILKTILNMPTS